MSTPREAWILNVESEIWLLEQEEEQKQEEEEEKEEDVPWEAESLGK